MTRLKNEIFLFYRFNVLKTILAFIFLWLSACAHKEIRMYETGTVSPVMLGIDRGYRQTGKTDLHQRKRSTKKRTRVFKKYENASSVKPNLQK